MGEQNNTVDIKSIKDALINDIKTIVDEKVEGIKKEVVTMDELRAQIAKLQERLATAQTDKDARKKAFAEFIRQKAESLTGASGLAAASVVPSNVADYILTELFENEWIFKECTVYPDNKGTIFYGGDTVQAQRVAVGTSGSDVDQQVEPVTYAVERMVVGQPVGKKLLQEAKPKLIDFLMENFRRAFANRLVYEFIKGTGTGENKGLDAYATITTETAGGTTIDSITYNDLVKLYYDIPKAYRKQAIWFMNTETLKVIKELKDNNNRPIFDDRDETLFNRPIIEIDAIDTTGATNPVIYFGYAKDYFIFNDGVFEFEIVTQDKEMVKAGQVYVQLTAYFDGKLATDKHFAALKLASA